MLLDQIDVRASSIADLAGHRAATNAVAAARTHAEAAAANSEVAATAAARVHTEAAVARSEIEAIEAAREHCEAAVVASSAQIGNHLAQIRQDLSRLDRSTSRPGTVATRTTLGHEGDVVSRSGEVDDLLYLAIEDRFRGDPTLVRSRQERYVPVVALAATAAHPMLDLGCGRGEWLQLAVDAGVPARGVDSNESCVDECRAAGLEVRHADLVEELHSLPDGSLGAITMFHVVEHLPFGVLADVMVQCARVLKPGGVLLAETPNALNLRVAASTFWLDPTHVRPLHPQLLRLLGERAGFGRMEDLFLHDVGSPPEPETGDASLDQWLTELGWILDGPGDYALLAWMPPRSDDP